MFWTHTVMGLVSLVIVFLLGGCQELAGDALLEAPSEQEIVTTSDYPAVVMVVLPDGGGVCSGTFISARAVLTAAHCTKLSGKYLIVSSFGRFWTRTRENFGPGELEDPNDVSLLLFEEDIADPEKGQVLEVDADLERYEKVRLVGFGCTDLQKRTGAGKKRTGTNQVYSIGEYIELTTPIDAKGDYAGKLAFDHPLNHAALYESRENSMSNARQIVGPENRAATCFGDSGGPMLTQKEGKLKVVGVTHAGGYRGWKIISQYASLLREDNYEFLNKMDSKYSLEIAGLCTEGLPSPGFRCGERAASVQLLQFFKSLWQRLLAWLAF